MVKVKDTPEELDVEEIKDALTPEEIKIWRKEREQKKQLRFIEEKLTKALEEWMADKDNKKKVKAFNNLSFQKELLLQQMQEN